MSEYPAKMPRGGSVDNDFLGARPPDNRRQRQIAAARKWLDLVETEFGDQSSELQTLLDEIHTKATDGDALSSKLQGAITRLQLNLKTLYANELGIDHDDWIRTDAET